MRNRIIVGIALVLIWGCSKEGIYIHENHQGKQTPNPAESTLAEQVYLIGDVGELGEMSAASLALLKKELTKADPESTSVVFLGDNIYPEGLHGKDHPLRAADELRINAQLDAVKDFKGEIVFIPGNHDWQQGGKDGFKFNKRQEDYIQKYLDNKVYHPSDGCSGPKEIELSDELTLLIIDTQWWLHKYEKGRGEKDDCATSTIQDFMLAFKEALKANRTKHVIVAAHHPMYSNGRHGGYFSFSDHLFPLRNLGEYYYLPTPLIGSIYPFYRSFFGNIQDIPNPAYQDMKSQITNAISQYDNVIYASGHEHNLQYFFQKNTHYVVSGSGSKVANLRMNDKLDFGAEHSGFAKIEVFQNGATVLKYFSSDNSAKGKDPILFEKKLYTKNIKGFRKLDESEKTSYEGMYKEVMADSNYSAGGMKRVFLGDLNRDIWTQPIKVPYLDIHHLHGGLQPIEKGGGQQTVSLKMIGADGKKYKLRQIRKSAQFLVIRELRGTVAQEMVYDGIAGSHPYASGAVGALLKAAELYYIEPKLVYIPKDPILGDYLDEFGGTFALLEVHPSKDMSDMDNFGNSKKVLNTPDAIEKLQKHQDHLVDVDFAVKNRLMDMLVGDWDRHDDQWRWATFKEDGKTLYRPIPRDRDQAFFKFDGVVMSIVNRKWLIRKFQPFDEDVRDIAGLNFNARYFDRSFLVEADRERWVEQAKAIQKNLTDEVIENAIRQLPPESYALNGEELIRLLKARREKLTEFAERYYEVLAKTVDVVGTTDKDYFEVKRLDGGKVEVNIYPRKDGKKVESERFYHRVFNRKETKEIRLYGLSDKDEYKLKGDVGKSILVRIIAGKKKDKIEDKSSASGLAKKTKIYEVEGKQEAEKSGETRLKTLDKGDALFYDRKAFVYDNVLPLPSIGFNADDGFIFGPGVSYVKHGFNKKPYAQKHNLLLNYTFKAEGYNIYYDGFFTDFIGKNDLELKTTINQPKVYQFYGEGNEVQPEESVLNNSLVRMNNNVYEAKLSRPSQDLSSRLDAIVRYRRVGIEEESTADISIADNSKEFIAAGLAYRYLNVDQLLSPSRGLSFSTEITNVRSIDNSDIDFIKLKSQLTFYFPINAFQKQAILAVRGAYAGNFGDYSFFQANFLSGTGQLRGLSRNRFAGKSVAYGNMELRKSFLKNKNTLALFDFGMLVHGDIGRVWIDDDMSDRWHNSYGGGLFINILDFFALVGSYSISDQDELVFVGTNFYF